MSLVLSTTSGVGLDIHTEAAVGAQFTATEDMWVKPSYRLSNLKSATSSLTVKAVHYASDGVSEIRTFGPYYPVKPSPKTVSGEQFERILLLSGEKLEIRALSSNALDTSVTWQIKWADPTYVASLADAALTSIKMALLGLFKLLMRNDQGVVSATADDAALINEDTGSGAGDYDPTVDSLQAQPTSTAAAILVDPENKLGTDSSNRVTTSNPGTGGDATAANQIEILKKATANRRR